MTELSARGLRGNIGAVLLRLLAGDTYGYQIMVATQLRSGIVYPILGRLEQLGYISTERERVRGQHSGKSRVYATLTRRGRRLAQEVASFHQPA